MAVGEDGRVPVEDQFAVPLGAVRDFLEIQEAGGLFLCLSLGHLLGWDFGSLVY